MEKKAVGSGIGGLLALVLGLFIAVKFLPDVRRYLRLHRM